MRHAFLPSLTRTIGIDLGTSRLRIWTNQDGYIVDEPTAIAVDTERDKVIAVGKEAREMFGRVSDKIVVSRPMSAGFMTNPELTQAMLRVFLQKVFKNPFFLKPIFMLSVPSEAGEAERSALLEVMIAVGAREVYFVDQLVAAAIGAGVPIADASGSFMLHLGAGVVETGIISLGSIIQSHTGSWGGDELDRAIQRVLRQSDYLSIGLATAEKLKNQLSDLREQPSSKNLRVTGQDLLESAPREVLVPAIALQTVLNQAAVEYVQIMKKLLEKIPAELTSDVIDKGLLLSGGLANLKGLDGFLLNHLGIPVSVVDEPERAVIKGVARILQNLDLFKESIGYQSTQLEE